MQQPVLGERWKTHNRVEDFHPQGKILSGIEDEKRRLIDVYETGHMPRQKYVTAPCAARCGRSGSMQG